MAVLALLLLLCCAGASAQVSGPTLRAPVPESAFVSKTQYTNAFFGFRLPLPEKHFQVVDLSDSNKALRHFLFAEKAVDGKGITLLIITAIQVLGNPQEEAEKTAFLPGEQGANPPEGLDIGGRLFWKNQTEQKTFSGKVVRLRYATALRGFVIVFSVSAQNGRAADELRQDIESMKFFDPVAAKEVAGTDSRPYLTAAVRDWLENSPPLDLTHLDAGALNGSTYSNGFFGFSYQFPAGWHVAEGSDPSPAEKLVRNAGKDRTANENFATQCTRVLSAATKFPQDDSSDAANPRILILAADPGCFAPDVKFPESVHDEQTIQLFGQALIRAFAGTPFLGRDASRLIVANLNGHLFLEMPSAGAVPIPGSTLLRKVHMYFVVTTIKKYWIIWLMESDTESELGRLIRTSISFPAH
jgi:hypothetical protein